ncbi:hypothetical protein B0H13DRAFT_1889508 [Mycena leptocephala]|nr:hypothetical protein B0H13DRAFT_1889508 [Mycena leptocephala]
MNARAKICKVLWMLRRPLISDGAEEKALLRGVEDGSPTCAVAKPLRRDGVSGRNARASGARGPHIQFQLFGGVGAAGWTRGTARRVRVFMLMHTWRAKDAVGVWGGVPGPCARRADAVPIRWAPIQYHTNKKFITETRSKTKLIFVGDDPHLSTLQRLCAQLGVDAIFMGQLTRRRLGEVVESADVMRFYIFGRKEFWGRSGAEGRKERRSANASVRGGTDLEFFFSLSKLWTTASDLVHVAGWWGSGPGCAQWALLRGSIFASWIWI